MFDYLSDLCLYLSDLCLSDLCLYLSDLCLSDLCLCDLCLSDLCLYLSDLCLYLSDLCLYLSDLCLSDLCLSHLCLYDLCLSHLYLSDLCLSNLYLSDLYLSDLCLSHLCLSHLCLSGVHIWHQNPFSRVCVVHVLSTILYIVYAICLLLCSLCLPIKASLIGIYTFMCHIKPLGPHGNKIDVDSFHIREYACNYKHQHCPGYILCSGQYMPLRLFDLFAGFSLFPSFYLYSLLLLLLLIPNYSSCRFSCPLFCSQHGVLVSS